MAKAVKSVAPSDGIDKAYLKLIVDATAANSPAYVGQVMGQPMLAHNPPLIEIETTMVNPNDPSQVLCRATSAASDYLAANAAAPVAADKPAGNYTIITNAILPEPKKRGNSTGSGAPTKYPFADMQVGASFFSADSEHAKGDALKALGSTVSSQNRKYATETGEHKTQKRAKRDDNNKPILDDQGKKIIETVTLPVLKYERKFTIRAVTGGQKYGEWVAPANGALIARTV